MKRVTSPYIRVSDLRLSCTDTEIGVLVINEFVL